MDDVLKSAAKAEHAEQMRIQKIIQDLVAQQTNQLQEQQLLLVSLKDIERSLLTSFTVIAGPKLVDDARANSPDRDCEVPITFQSGKEDGKAFNGEGTSSTTKISTLKMVQSTTRQPKRHYANGYPWARAIVKSDQFTSLTAVIIALNAAFIAIESDNYIQRVVDTWKQTPHDEWLPSKIIDEPGWILPVELTFSALFTIELLLRCLGEGMGFVFGLSRGWNALDSISLLSVYLDLFLVAISVEGFEGISFLRLLRLAKTFRSLRVIRALRFAHDMNVMLKTIYRGFPSLCSALLAMCGMVFIVDLVLLQLLAEFIRDSQAGNEEVGATIDDFGTFFQTTLTLWTAVFDEWRCYYDVLAGVSPGIALLFFICTLMIVVGPLNIITGIFVEQAHENLKADLEYVKHNQRQNAKRALHMLSSLFGELDADHSGIIKGDEWAQYLQTSDAHDAFTALGLDIEKFQSTSFFERIDTDGTGDISYEEFVLTCIGELAEDRQVDELMLKHNNLELCKDIDTRMRWHTSNLQSQFDAALTSVKSEIERHASHAQTQFDNSLALLKLELELQLSGFSLRSPPPALDAHLLTTSSNL